MAHKLTLMKPFFWTSGPWRQCWSICKCLLWDIYPPGTSGSNLTASFIRNLLLAPEISNLTFSLQRKSFTLRAEEQIIYVTCLAQNHKPSKKCQYVYYIMTFILISSEWSLLFFFFFGSKLLEHTKNTLNINLRMLPDTKSLLHWFTVLHHIIFYSCSYFTAHHSQEGIVSLLAIKKCFCSTAFSKEQWG